MNLVYQFIWHNVISNIWEHTSRTLPRHLVRGCSTLNTFHDLFSWWIERRDTVVRISFTQPETTDTWCKSLNLPTVDASLSSSKVEGLRWCSGQTTRLSPLRFRVRSPVRFTLMWTRTQSSCEKSIVNALPKVVGFLRVLRFPPTGKVDRVGR